MAAGDAACGPEHTLSIGGVDVDAGGDRVRTARDHRPGVLGDVRAVWVEDVLIAGCCGAWPVCEHLFERGAGVERQPVVYARVVKPELLELLQSCGLLGGEVLRLCAVHLEVVELPLVVLEVSPSGEGRVHRARKPPLVVDRALPEHRVKLRLLARYRGIGERGREALTL